MYIPPGSAVAQRSSAAYSKTLFHCLLQYFITDISKPLKYNTNITKTNYQIYFHIFSSCVPHLKIEPVSTLSINMIKLSIQPYQLDNYKT